MKISELKESIKTDDFDVYFNDYSLTINISTRNIHALSGSRDIYKILDQLDTKDAIEVEKQYELAVNELVKNTESEIAEITDSFTNILKAVMIDYKTKKDKKLEELKNAVTRKR